jgi:hypothetical protein
MFEWPFAVGTRFKVTQREEHTMALRAYNRNALVKAGDRLDAVDESLFGVNELFPQKHSAGISNGFLLQFMVELR